MITLIIWALVGALLGILHVALLPWIAARIAGPDYVEEASSAYIWLAQSAVSKSALIVRPGSVDLVAKSYDPEQKADKDTAGGEPRHHRDSLNTLSHLANKPFGLTLHDVDEYVSPLLADIGSAAKSAMDREEIGDKQDDDGKRVMQDGIPTSGVSQLVDLTDAKHLVSGDADPEDGHRAYKKTVISQEKFHEKMTFGQTVMLVGAFLASAAVLWLLATRDVGEAASTTTVSTLLFSIGLLDADQLKNKLTNGDLLRKAAAIGVVIGAVLGIPIIALFTGGLLAAALTFIISIAIAIAWPLGIALFGPSLPAMIGAPLARIHWTLAQLTVGRGVLVERDTGHYEHHAIRRAPEPIDTPFYCILNNGQLLPIEGSEADFLRFGWAPLALTCEKTTENMRTITHEPDDSLLADGGLEKPLRPDNTRQGFQPEFRKEAIQADWLVTLPQLAQWCRGSAESESIREGRDTALTEQGGQQQISSLVYVMLVIFAMVAGGLFGLIAGGAII